MVGFQFDRDAGVGRLQRGEPRGQPSFGDGFDGDDPDAAGPAAVTLGHSGDFGEDPFHVFEVGLPVAVQVDAPLVAVEQLRVQMLLERPDPVADRGGGDTELGRGVFEAPVAGGGLEEPQALKRRQAQRSPEQALKRTASCRGPPGGEGVPLTAGSGAASSICTPNQSQPTLR